MPGISLYTIRKKIKQNGNFILRSINLLIHDDNYESEVLLTNNLYFLACTRYPEYPITIFENDKVWICLEGMIYNKESSQTNRELNHLLTGIYENWPLTIKLLVGY
jgi:hypothetical protein